MADDSNRYLWLFSLALFVFFFSLHSQNLRHQQNIRLSSSTTQKPATQKETSSPLPRSTSNSILLSVRGSEQGAALARLQLPSAADFLPKNPELHLRLHLLSDNRTEKARVVFGVLVTRIAFRHFLLPLLRDLVANSDHEERRTLLVVVFVTRRCHHLIDAIVKVIQQEFWAHDGVIEVISVSDAGYPAVPKEQKSSLEFLMRGTLEQKFNADVAFMMAFARPRADFFVPLEDDARAARALLVHSLLDEAQKRQTNSSKWFLLDFSPDLKFSGKLFRSKHLNLIIHELLAFREEKSYHWLLDHVIMAKFCTQFLFWVRCGERNALWVSDVPLLFQEGQMTKFVGQKIIKAEQLEKNMSMVDAEEQVNRTLVKSVSSTIRHFKNHSFARLLRGDDFFWGQSPAKDEALTIIFANALNMSSYEINSGHPAAEEDILRDATLEIQPAALDKFILQPNITFSEDGFTKIDTFDESGACSGNVPEEFQPIVGVRVRINKDNQQWVLLNKFSLVFEDAQ